MLNTDSLDECLSGDELIARGVSLETVHDITDDLSALAVAVVVSVVGAARALNPSVQA